MSDTSKPAAPKSPESDARPMVELHVDGRALRVPAGTTLLQACEQSGVEIPRFCYHERLSIAGNCRMCLVELEGSAKPVASCAEPAANGQRVRTNSAMVQAARKGVMEFLLINHPLDCPICDQGGECDLQDQALGFGLDHSRFATSKRAVPDKNMGPLVKTIMTRCIHCTRCVRFASEVAGVPEIGAIGRGEDMEIVSWLDQALTSELSGNVIDLCPVGALTSKPYVFSARPWELSQTNSIDVMDGMGCHIRLDSRDGKIMRILPREHDEINEEWLSDKARFVWDGLTRQRLDQPWRRKGGRLEPCSWADALRLAARALTKASARKGRDSRLAALAGDVACVESMKVLKDLMDACASPHLDCRQSGALYPHQARAQYVMTSGFAGIHASDALLLVGTNPRHDAAVLNARIFQHWRRGEQGATPIGFVGAPADLPSANLPYVSHELGEGGEALCALLDGSSPFAPVLRAAARPLLLVGEAAFREAGEDVFAALMELVRRYKIQRPQWSGFNMLHHAAARVGGLDVGFVPQSKGWATKEIVAAAQSGRAHTLILLGADELELKPHADCCVIYIGSHGDRGAQCADLVLPGATYAEKSALYVNSEGRVQETAAALPPPGAAKEDWMIVRALAEQASVPLPYGTRAALRAAIYAAAPALRTHHERPQLSLEVPAPGAKPNLARLAGVRFGRNVSNFYLSNPMARASPVLGECSRLAAERRTKDEAERRTSDKDIAQSAAPAAEEAAP